MAEGVRKQRWGIVGGGILGMALAGTTKGEAAGLAAIAVLYGAGFLGSLIAHLRS